MPDTYHIRIKKDYASAILKDLEKMDAVEMLPDNDIPEWQMILVHERLEAYKKNPAMAMDFETAMDEIDKDLRL